MFIEADAARFKPVNFNKLVEELAGTLIQVAKLTTFIFVS